MKNSLVILCIVLITACAKKQPQCTGEQIKFLLLSAYEKDLQAHLSSQSDAITKSWGKMFPVNTDSIVASYLRNGILSIEKMSTAGTKPEGDTCGCKATLTYRLSQDFISAYQQNAALFTLPDYFINPGFETTNVDVEVGYTVSVTDEKEKIGLEKILADDLHRSLEQFTFVYSLNEIVQLKLKTPK